MQKQQQIIQVNYADPQWLRNWLALQTVVAQLTFTELSNVFIHMRKRRKS
jgi:hypothetical protein